MAADSRLVTHALRFSSAAKGVQPILFLNADFADSTSLSLSVLDAATGTALPGLSEADCKGAHGAAGATSGDRLAVSWTGGAMALSAAANKPVRLSVRFRKPVARLFSFWVARDACGASDGWVAAGGASFNSSRDLYGSCSGETTVDGASSASLAPHTAPHPAPSPTPTPPAPPSPSPVQNGAWECYHGMDNHYKLTKTPYSLKDDDITNGVETLQVGLGRIVALC